jgi:hypothetical protein
MISNEDLLRIVGWSRSIAMKELLMQKKNKAELVDELMTDVQLLFSLSEGELYGDDPRHPEIGNNLSDKVHYDLVDALTKVILMLDLLDANPAEWIKQKQDEEKRRQTVFRWRF